MDQQAVEIAASVKRILETVPPDVIVVAAAKGRTPAEVKAAIQAGITHVGHNYVQEARAMIPALGDSVTWHMIGHLQRNNSVIRSRRDLTFGRRGRRLSVSRPGICPT